VSRKIIEGREFSKCTCGNVKSTHAKQCRECYQKNGGHHAEIYNRTKIGAGDAHGEGRK
jgi:hypothetical protein